MHELKAKISLKGIRREQQGCIGGINHDASLVGGEDWSG
jgi:hypothetical protein